MSPMRFTGAGVIIVNDNETPFVNNIMTIRMMLDRQSTLLRIAMYCINSKHDDDNAHFAMIEYIRMHIYIRSAICAHSSLSLFVPPSLSFLRSSSACVRRIIRRARTCAGRTAAAADDAGKLQLRLFDAELEGRKRRKGGGGRGEANSGGIKRRTVRTMKDMKSMREKEKSDDGCEKTVGKQTAQA